MLHSEVKKVKQSLRPIYTEADCDRTVKTMNALLDIAGDDEDHLLSSRLNLTSDLVSGHEQEHHWITVAVYKNVGSGIPEPITVPSGMHGCGCLGIIQGI